MRHRLVLLLLSLLAVLILGVGLASSSPAQTSGVIVGKDAAGDVNAKGLTKAERDAMDIVSVRVTGASDLGAFVTVTFRGDFQKAIGRGHLANAAAALVLKPSAKAALTAGLISTGSGKVGSVFRETKSTAVGAFRSGKTLTFFILGPGFGNVKSVAVETVQNAGKLDASRATSAATGPPPPSYIGPRLWDKFLTLHPIDFRVMTSDPSGLSCGELQNLLDSIDTDLGDQYFHVNVSFSVTTALNAFRATVKGLRDKCAPPPTLNATFAWSPFSANEVAGSGVFTGPKATFVAVKVVLPSTFMITNHLCPHQLPNGIVSGNTIICNGGTLVTGQSFNLNLQTSPFPSAAMGGELFGEENTTFDGPFAITGP